MESGPFFSIGIESEPLKRFFSSICTIIDSQTAKIKELELKSARYAVSEDMNIEIAKLNSVIASQSKKISDLERRLNEKLEETNSRIKTSADDSNEKISEVEKRFDENIAEMKSNGETDKLITVQLIKDIQESVGKLRDADDQQNTQINSIKETLAKDKTVNIELVQHRV